MGMCGWFVEDRIALGDVKMRNTPLSLNLNPRTPRYSAPVAVLIDECSISAAEVMSGGMQDLGIARLFGSKTAGLVLPSTVAKLPSGDGFQYAIADYQSASGRKLELNGVVPDVEISVTRESWQGGSDPVLESAVEWITKQHSTLDQ
jgi:carboxyl-terminal processing protease